MLKEIIPLHSFLSRFSTRKPCAVNQAAGVVCIDANKLKLVGGSKRDGNVYIGDLPVCGKAWDKLDAQVVCNSLYANDFSERRGVVPVFDVSQAAAYGQATTDTFIMDEVRCNGNEKSLTDCSFKSYNEKSCGRSQVAGVRCAKCTHNELLDIVSSVTLGSNTEATEQSVTAAFNRLKSKCYHWDCSIRQPAYREYCQIHAFLHDSLHVMKKSLKRQVALVYNPGKLLMHHFTKERSDIVLQRLQSIRQQSASMQGQLADYYRTMANFDKTRGNADHAYAIGVWKDQKDSVVRIQNELKEEMTDLVWYAVMANGADLIYRYYQVSWAMTACLSPFDAVFNPGEMAEKVANVDDKLAELTEAIGKTALFQYTISDTFPKMRATIVTIVKNLRDNAVIYDTIADMLGKVDTNNFTPERANQFLEAYYRYNPAIMTEPLATYVVLIDQVVDNFCDTLTSSGGIIKAGIAAAAFKVCPVIRQKVEIMKDLLTDLKDVQLDIMDAFADMARAKVSELAARKLSQVIGQSSMDILLSKVAEKQSQVLFQLHRAALINTACDTIKYMKFGVEQDHCAYLRKNTFGDVQMLIGFEYRDENAMCPQMHTDRTIFHIPAMVRRGDEQVPHGMLDLTSLWDASQDKAATTFQIPNAQWLVDNGWINPADSNSGPFVVKKLEVYPLPVQTKDKVTVTTRFSPLTNILAGETYLFDRQVSAFFSYDENNPWCDYRYLSKNPYSVLGCQALPDICGRSEGVFPGPIYPSLFSLWNFEMSIPKVFKANVPYPKGKFYLKVRAEICYRSRSSGLRVGKRSGIYSCCANSGRYSDEKGRCHGCPKESRPSLNGFFCESCPKGYAPSTDGPSGYGCRPCPVNMYNGVGGNTHCLPCSHGQNTNGTEGSTFCTTK